MSCRAVRNACSLLSRCSVPGSSFLATSLNPSALVCRERLHTAEAELLLVVNNTFAEHNQPLLQRLVRKTHSPSDLLKKKWHWEAVTMRSFSKQAKTMGFLHSGYAETSLFLAQHTSKEIKEFRPDCSGCMRTACQSGIPEGAQATTHGIQ